MNVTHAIGRIMVILLCLSVCGQVAYAQASRSAKLMDQWGRILGSTPLNEDNFRIACSLISEINEQDAVKAMTCTNQLIQKVRPTNRRIWMHALLTNKYELAQVVYPFLDSAASIVDTLRKNAGGVRDLVFREAIVYSVHAYSRVGGMDDANKFIVMGMDACTEAGDSLNLAMLHMFKGELLSKSDPETSDRALAAVVEAQKLSEHLPNKTPYFASSYLAAHIAYFNNPAKLVGALERLVPLSGDPSLTKPDFYSQTFFPFSKPNFTIYLDLMRLNLVLMDFQNARRSYQLIEAALISRKRKTGILNDRSLGMLVSDRVLIEAFAGNRTLTAQLLDSCRNYFATVAENDIPSVNYFLARALLDEMDGQYVEMLNTLKILQSKYVGAVLPLSLTTLHAHAHALNGNADSARLYFDMGLTEISDRDYSSIGYYHYKYYAEWLLSRGDYPAYANALTMFYDIKDSIASTQQMRNMAEVQTELYVKQRETEIDYLKKIREVDARFNRFVRYGGLIVLTSLLLVVGFLYSRYRQKKKNHATLLKKNERIETLIRELHHRVRNNLQVVSSLLSLQSLRMSAGEEREAIMEGQRRVEVMSLIHQKLYQHEDVTGVDMKAYIDELVQGLMDSYGVSAVEVRLEIDEIWMDIDTAIPMGLIINELITNSLKYGVGKAGGDRLIISLRNFPTYYRLTLADNGPGLPDGFSIENTPSFGLKLVHTLVKQLRATITGMDGPGAVFKLIIPR